VGPSKIHFRKWESVTKCRSLGGRGLCTITGVWIAEIKAQYEAAVAAAREQQKPEGEAQSIEDLEQILANDNLPPEERQRLKKKLKKKKQQKAKKEAAKKEDI